MDSSSSKYGITIYGKGAVGLALWKCLGESVPIVTRSNPTPTEGTWGLVCWPAHALEDFTELYRCHPELEVTRIVTFCNGAWVPDTEVLVSQGCAYVRAKPDGSFSGMAKWRVSDGRLANTMRKLGALVTCSLGKNHLDYVWGKALYLVPLALACQDLHETAKEVIGSDCHLRYYHLVLDAARVAMGDRCLPDPQIKRVAYLWNRLPKGWTPSPSAEELAYFRQKLGVS